MQWSGVMGIVPALALLLPFFAIMCFILLLFGIDTSKDIENYMIFTGWMAIIFTIVVVAITQWMTLLFKSMDTSLSLFEQSKDTRNTDEILDCLYQIQKNIQYFSRVKNVLFFTLTEESYQKTIKKLTMELNFLIEFGHVLKSQLSKNIEWQKDILASTLSQNIAELGEREDAVGVLHMQQLRLHKQMTQFEQLQAKIQAYE